jgi:hypothetical protein
MYDHHARRILQRTDILATYHIVSVVVFICLRLWKPDLRYSL